MWIVRLALRRPYTFVVMALLIMLLGVLSIATTPTDIFPEIDIPVVSLIWDYQGLATAEMANQITTFSEYTLSSAVNDVRNIVRRAVQAAGGREVDARADEFFAVFEPVVGALEAAVAIQRALGGRAWPDDLECRIRAGIHSGRPTLTDTGYIGLPIHTAARICEAAHGGQILVSSETKAALKGSLPAGLRFRNLGRYRLPGLTKSEALFQVEADGLISDFPPPRIRAGSPIQRGR